MHAVLCVAGYKIRLLLKNLRLFYAQFGLDLQELLTVLKLGYSYVLQIDGCKVIYSDPTK